MIQLMESTAHNAVAPFLSNQENTIGIQVEVRHLAPSLLGTRVEAKATLVEVDGRRLVFRIEAFDPLEKVGEGLHERYVIDTGRYQERLDRKRSALTQAGNT